MASLELATLGRRGALLGGVVLVLALLSSCGSASTGASAADKLDGLSASTAVHQAYDQLSSENYRADFSQDTKFDTSGLSAPVASRMRASLTDKQSAGTEAVESYTRLKMAIQIPALGKTLYLVAYDGTIYASTDDSTYKEAPFLSGLAHQLLSAQTSQMAGHLQGLHDLGRTSIGAATVEHYTGSLTSDYLVQLVQNILGGVGAGGTTTTAFTAATTMASSLDFFIDRHTGQVVREVFVMTITMDMGKLATAEGQSFSVNPGVLKIVGNTSLEFHDFGKSAGLSRPTSAGQLSASELSRLLGQ